MSRKMNLQNNTETGKPKRETKKNINVRYFPIFGIPIVKTALPQNQIDELNNICDEVLNSPEKVDHSNKLAGVIKKGQQVLLPHKHNKDPEKDRTIKVFRKNIVKLCEAYISQAVTADEGSKELWSKYKSKIIQTWIVSQYDNDYNPPHTHGGVLSGILYLKVPKRISEDLDCPDGKLSFQGWLPYKPEWLMFNQNHSINPEIGTLYIFPAWLSHQVYPFDFNEERRCISFNLNATPLGESKPNVKY